MKHDYKATLDAFDRNIPADFVTDNEADRTYYQTIRHALLMMQKLEEPSHGIIGAYILAQGDDAKVNYTDITNGLKAMLEQAKREIADG